MQSYQKKYIESFLTILSLRLSSPYIIFQKQELTSSVLTIITIKKLVIKILTYNPCFLITKNQEGLFGIIGIQTNNIFILRNS
jgi:hypothetical protein